MVRLRNAVMVFVLATGLTGCSALQLHGRRLDCPLVDLPLRLVR